MNMRATQLPSNLQIDDEVSFRPMYHQQMDLGIADEWRDGVVVAIRFTKAKVFYDILDTYFGIMFNTVDSIKVRAAGDFLPPIEEEDEEDEE